MTTIKTTRSIVALRQGRNDWYRIENKAGATAADVYIYDEIGYFGVTAADFVRDLNATDTKAITLHLNSPGGDMFDGLAIFNALRNHPATVTARIEGFAASAASFIAMAGDTVIAEKASQIMIHDAMAAAIGLNATEMRDMAALLDKSSDQIADIYAGKAGGDREQWRAAMRAETWYTAGEAKAAGLVDEVAGDSTDKDQTNHWDLSIFNFAGRASAPTPALPANPAPAIEPVFQFDPEVFRAAMKEAAQ